MRINKDLMRSLGLGLLSAQTGPSRTPITGWQTFGKGLASGFDRYNKLQERQAEIARQEIEDKRSAEEFKLRQQQAKATLEAAQRKARLDAAKEQGIQAWLADPDNQKKYPAFVAAYKAGFPPSTAVKLMPSKASDKSGNGSFGKGKDGLAWNHLYEAAARFAEDKIPVSELDANTRMRVHAAKAIVTQDKFARDSNGNYYKIPGQKLPPQIAEMFGEPASEAKPELVMESAQSRKQKTHQDLVMGKIQEALELINSGGAKGGVAGVVASAFGSVQRQFEESLGNNDSPVDATTKLKENLALLTQQLLPEISKDTRFTEGDVSRVRDVIGQVSVMTDTAQIRSRLNALRKFLESKGYSANQTAADGYTFSPQAQAILDKQRQEQN